MIIDSDILTMSKVTPQIAARYLGVSDDMIRKGLQDGRFPFGTAIKSRNSDKWIYDIRPDALVQYKHYGNLLNVDVLINMLSEMLSRKDVKNELSIQA